jgi:hypothetical protein
MDGGMAMTSAANLKPWEEHHFWLKILYDHAHFVRDYLSPTEKDYVKMAEQYIEQFAQIRKRLEGIDRDQSVFAPEMVSFARDAHQLAYNYFSFESHLAYLRLRNKINLNLTPSFLTGTLLENREYLRILGYFTCGREAPPLSLGDLLDLWLEDQAGHAELLANGLDPTEAEIVSQSQLLSRTFLSLLGRNRKYQQLETFTEHDVPERETFVRIVISSVEEFLQIVEHVLKQYRDQQVMSRLTYRFLEHHLPETCYFLKKLSRYAPVRLQCQLTPPYFSQR